jgi:hypothetical protein
MGIHFPEEVKKKKRKKQLSDFQSIQVSPAILQISA